MNRIGKSVFVVITLFALLAIIITIFSGFVPTNNFLLQGGLQATPTINATVLENGDVAVVEEIQYTADKDSNGYYREFFYSCQANNPCIDENSIKVERDGQTYNRIPNGTDVNKYKGVSNIFLFENTGDRQRIYEYYPQEINDEVNIKYYYTVKNAAGNIDGGQRIYWKFISGSDGMIFTDVKLNIHFEKKLQEDTLFIYPRGNVGGDAKLNSETQIISATIPTIANSESFAEIDILIRGKQLNTNLVREGNVDTLINDYNTNANDLQPNNRGNEMILSILGIVVTFLVSIYILYKFYINHDKERKLDKPYDYYRDVPNKISPASARLIMDEISTINSQDINSTILYLLYEKVFTIEKRNGSNYLVRLDKDVNHYEEHVKFVANKFINSMDFGAIELNLDMLNKPSTNTNSSLEVMGARKKFFDTFAVLLTRDVGSLNYFKTSFHHQATPKERSIIGLSIMLLIIGVIATFFLTIFSGLLITPLLAFMLFAFIALIIYRSNAHQYTAVGAIEANKWMAFKQYMVDYSLIKDATIDALVIWEYYLVYASAFGIADKVMGNLRISIPDFKSYEMNSSQTFQFLYFHHYMSTTNFNNTIAQSFTQPASFGSSGSGMGGSFSGGGGGGFGGGGGGSF